MSLQTVKVTVSIPEELVKIADRVAKERKTSRSKVVSSCLEELARKKINTELEEGYRAMAKINKQVAHEFFEAQREVIIRDKTSWTE